MKSVAVFLGVTLIAVAAARGGQQTTDPALDKLAGAFAEAFNAKDAPRVASFYAEDAIVMAPKQPMVKGRRNIESYYVRGFQQDVSNFRLFPMESATSGAHAFEAGRSSLTAQRSASSRGGPEASTTSGKYVVIYKRVNGEWKIAYDIFNDD
jgi:ketosteroid isomerase-like protein